MLTTEELKALAYQAAESETGKREFTADLAWLVAFARLVEAAERERCAKLCESLKGGVWTDAAQTCANAIRDLRA